MALLICVGRYCSGLLFFGAIAKPYWAQFVVLSLAKRSYGGVSRSNSWARLASSFILRLARRRRRMYRVAPRARVYSSVVQLPCTLDRLGL
ncbi:hypothetical protein [Candidatus Methylacidithermus pantelleriae]|uniref:Uncharacterized protein n=1 Tax=Candidatus Methylacidithermus pantelleriae TaxID=2744239 RepID=A0A8J2FNQ8_9BACT|nr:hypothetical protein [Candidatus Methylacidithermus pantelleriae]CAF0694455.1 hypothetical protein MPNT_160059 [Candidatus Methylacidithermus pantelleriae]